MELAGQELSECRRRCSALERENAQLSAQLKALRATIARPTDEDEEMPEAKVKVEIKVEEEDEEEQERAVQAKDRKTGERMVATYAHFFKSDLIDYLYKY